MKYINHLKCLLFAVGFLSFGNSALAVSSGTYVVGPGGSFADLQAVLADLQTSTVTGPLVYEIVGGDYSGSQWQMKLEAVAGVSATNTITFRPQASTSVKITVQGSIADNYVFNLHNTAHVIIQNLELVNDDTASGRVISLTGTTSNCKIINCTLSTASGAAFANDNRAILSLGNGTDALTGSNNIIQDNLITGGYCGIMVRGGSSTTTDNNTIIGNTIDKPVVYGAYISQAGNITFRNNEISGTDNRLTHGLFISYTTNGGTIADNKITINTTTGTHYGLYANFVNSTGNTVMNVTDNEILTKATSGTAYALYNNRSSFVHYDGNTMNAEATSGKVYMPVMAEGGTDIVATNNTFGSKVTTGGINNTTDYRFINNTTTSADNNITVRQNVFNLTVTTGTVGTTSSAGSFMYYPRNCIVNNNDWNFTRTGSSGNFYSFGGYYFVNRGTNNSFDSNSMTFTHSAGGTIYNLSYYYAYYYGTDNSFSNNTVTAKSGTATTYATGRYLGYRENNFKCDNNKVDIEATGSATSYTYYYPVYYAAVASFKNNEGTVTGKGGTIGNPYAMNYYATGTDMSNNTFVTDASTATIYSPYHMNYQGAGRQYNNSFTSTATGSGTTYACYYLNGYGASDTVENNTWNMTRTGGTFYNYNYYLSGLVRNNTWNVNNGSGTIYIGPYAGQGGIFENNELNLTTTSGTIYGTYPSGSSSSYKWTLRNNRYNLRSNTGTVYGYYAPAYAGTYTYMGNVVTTQTAGISRLYYTTYGFYGNQLFFNNTFHSNSTGSTNEMYRQSGGSNSYKGKMYLYNNIFTSAKAFTGNAIDIADTSYISSDHNLVFAPGTVTRKCASPSITTTSFTAWKKTTGNDHNSLMRDPGLTDPANGNLRPNPASPNSWAIQGRGMHLEGDTLDFDGNPRAKTRFDGVPDLGAYEFTPTSTPPDADASPSAPSMNTRQFFTFGGDTVCTIDWGNTVPSTVSVKQYTGIKASPITPSVLERTFFYVEVQAPTGVYEYIPYISYKDGWLGNISNETNARIAKSSNGGLWQGYNNMDGITDSVHNSFYPATAFDSLGSKFTGVENGRIGIRCAYSPTGLQSFDITATSAKLSWDEVYFPIGYQIVVDTVKKVDPAKAQFSSVSNFNISSGLVEDTWYYVYVRTICGLADTSGWTLDSFQTLVTCHAPDLQLSTLKWNQAVVYWDPVVTAVEYETALDNSPMDPTHGTMVKTTTMFNNNLMPGTEYYVHVRTHCSGMYEESDWATLKFMTPFATGIDEVGNNTGIAAYPNPVKDVLTLQTSFTPSADAVVTISDVTGKTVYTGKVSARKTEINLNRLPSGMYLLKYTDNGKSDVMKLTKE